MKTTFILFAALLGICALVGSCQKDENPDAFSATDKNSVTLEFDNRVGGQNLILGQSIAKNTSGEDFTVTKLNYFISNVALTKDDGTVVKFPDSYFLIREADPQSLLAKLPDVPAGNYKEVSFVVGVDSARSVANVAARTGVLDVASYGDDGMYWSWNSGYIFMKLEGTSPVVPLRASGQRLFEIHVGGFGGYSGPAPNNLRRVTLPVGSELAKVRKDVAPEIHFYVDAAKILDGKTKISLATTNNIHSPSLAKPVADNYTEMFAVDHVHNEKQ
ncbi:MAG: hypothetical protein H7Y12_08630 [Sphingobacteriaceae bacterium]|nr:hypothetical protein [Cytophagaceae bacterium]